ncbi:aldose epimerase family protein [Corticibacterium sp. UT-5YL-CI-8]|nr:aldose epimerase family protein [Tianweitania sp. UT-5YL-CI-8]
MRRVSQTLRDGTTVETITVGKEDGLQTKILTLGATLSDLVVPVGGGKRRSVILGFDEPQGHRDTPGFLGVVAGRCANRTAGGRFELDGQTHQLDLNEKSRTHLHGGSDGFWNRIWTVLEADEDFVLLALTSPDGDQGYPGAVQVTCRYTASATRLTIALEARTDRPTLVNLATHAYFNLDGEGDILGHRLTIPAESYTPIDDALIPTGEIATVEDTRFDFRKPRSIGQGDAGHHEGYDHNFVLAMQPAERPHRVARLEGAKGDTSMEIWSTEPGLQFYDGAGLPLPHPLRGGRESVRFGGLCLEPQRFPDAINHADFAGAVLRPSEIYSQVTEYRFG